MRKNIQLSLFLFLIILLSSFTRYEYFTTMFKLKFKDTAKPADGSVPDFDSMPNKSILIVNKTNDNLNIFIHPQQDENGSLLDDMHKIDNLSSQNIQIGARINWGKSNNTKSWDPLGAHPTRQIIIPKNGWVTFNNPIPTPTGGGAHNNQLIIIPIKFSEGNSDTIITHWNGSEETRPVKLKQSPLKFELGDKVISDSSAVDGINFKIKYQLTSDGKILQTEIVDNPCATLNNRYKLDVGCYSPPKLDCGINEVEAENQATADCKPSSQECRFNKCSKKFFKIPSKFSRYERVYDKGEGSSRNKGFGPVKATVAYVDNIDTNLPGGKDLKAYCKAVNGKGDFTTYCYDYNDVSSSKNLTDPYKIRIEISDLE
jgi:hypothetical protein